MSESKNDMDNVEAQEENIRPPDAAITECLMDDSHSSFQNIIDNHDDEDDDELFILALKLSNDEHEKQIRKQLEEQEKQRQIEEAQRQAIQMEIQRQNQRLLVRKEKMEIRIESLKHFCERVRRMIFTEKEEKLKSFLKRIVNAYCNGLIDNVEVDNELYSDLYKLIDSLYLIPVSQNRRPAIPAEEDAVLRKLFTNGPLKIE
jgi:hypothetical protein